MHNHVVYPFGYHVLNLSKYSNKNKSYPSNIPINLHFLFFHILQIHVLILFPMYHNSIKEINDFVLFKDQMSLQVEQ